MLWIFLSLLGGCDDTDFPSHAPEGPEGDGYEAVMQIFGASCAGCHNADGSFPDLVTDPCRALVGQPSQGYDGDLVTAGDAEASVIWHKMFNTGDFGGIMPAGASETLPEETLSIITDWIDAGAQCSEADTDTDTDTDTDAEVFFSDLYPALSGQCAGCHDDGGSGGLSLNDENAAYTTLTTESSSAGPLFVDIASPASSYLYLKIIGDPSINGAPMPDSDGMEPGDAEMVLTWIEQGARP